MLDEVDGLTLDAAVAEKKTYFDAHSGPRNHDLLIEGGCAAGPITVAVEAKADEPFDLPLWQYREEGLKQNLNTKKLERIDHLDKLWFSTRLKDDRVRPPLVTLGYQLFSALAGTLADAKLHGSAIAVLIVLEFRTNLTDDAEHAHNGRVLEEFLHRLLGDDHARRETPDGSGWITEPQLIRGDGKKMPLETQVSVGKLARDFRDRPGA